MDDLNDLFLLLQRSHVIRYRLLSLVEVLWVSFRPLRLSDSFRLVTRVRELHADGDFRASIVLQDLLLLGILVSDYLEEFLRHNEAIVLRVEGDTCGKLELWPLLNVALVCVGVHCEHFLVLTELAQYSVCVLS